ncbi:PREDICTED: probable protein phosphatase 2C 34 isoform X2 [Camelina sativa]|nr:PREDICTED: probable protein phosphatase 2C 34 isoform X2 [Camelina sativa]XP_010486023.1 PREDICTED: probable protein phosphatase 2C 34 isoform X2 [Camelina sativa]
MGHLSSMFNGLARSFSIKKAKNKNGKSYAKEAADEMAREAKKKDLILRSSGCINADGSNNLASVFSRRGEKGVNQDCAIVWEGFGCQEDMIFCGIFDGHGPWGHFVSKQVRNSMPISLLCNWKETLSQTTLAEPETDLDESDKKLQRFAIWKYSYLKTCEAVDRELEHHRKIDSFNSGTTALTVVRQGEVMYIANVGDSRAVLATVSDEGSLVAVQLTVDFKPNLPQEEERIIGCNGRVFCLQDEPGVHRVWQPEEEYPGLAMSRAFGDYCIKEYGLVSVPEVTQRHISIRDQFVILATDGVWDVISNQEAIDIVSSTDDRPKAAKRLVQQAVKAWNRKRRGIAMDDISAVCLFFQTSQSSSSISQHVHPDSTL